VRQRLRAHEDPDEEKRRRHPEPERRSQPAKAVAQPLAQCDERDDDDGEVGELEPEVRRAERDANRRVDT
jgi:hypothetical protein